MNKVTSFFRSPITALKSEYSNHITGLTIPTPASLYVAQDLSHVVVQKTFLLYFSYSPEAGKSFDMGMEVPSLYTYDGASIPNIFRPLLGDPTTAEYLEAAAVHDYLYEFGDEYGYPLASRKLADDLFYAILLQSNVSKWKAKAMHIGVRMGGIVFDKHRKAERAGHKVKATAWNFLKILLGAEK